MEYSTNFQSIKKSIYLKYLPKKTSNPEHQIYLLINQFRTEPK